MRAYLLLCFAIGVAGPTVAAEETVQDQVLACFAGIGASTEWNTCLSIMFAPCADKDVGSEKHLACLIQQREDWRLAKRTVEAGVLKALSDTGMEELSGLMLAWPKFVEDKCSAVAEGRADISYDAAQLGCQISEFALMTNELTACLEGRSIEAYCQVEAE